jgi:pyrophosphatase PpaX
MRFPVVLFDFDGTVIDSGSIIIASMRHATKTVLGRDIPDEELGRAVGGSGLIEQMRLIDAERHKPDPAPLVHALERLGADRDDAVYVGDSPFDIRAAKAAGMHSVAVTWGRIHPRERLEAEEPDAVVETAEELLAAL